MHHSPNIEDQGQQCLQKHLDLYYSIYWKNLTVGKSHRTSLLRPHVIIIQPYGPSQMYNQQNSHLSIHPKFTNKQNIKTKIKI